MSSEQFNPALALADPAAASTSAAGLPLKWEWIHTGDAAFARMVNAIQQARQTVDFETYIYSDSDPGRQIRAALEEAARRGIRVRVLIDSFGSLGLSDAFWEPLRQAGGTVRWFNPLSLRRFNIRNHRKLVVCDTHTAFLGGFNVSQEWVGDGIQQGWRDLGLVAQANLAVTLADSFEQIFQLADFRHHRPQRLHARQAVSFATTRHARLLAAGPGRGRHPIRTTLLDDLRQAREVRIIAAYFLPPGRILRALRRVARRGGLVHLILPARSDIPLMRSATRGLYGRLLRDKIRIHEYTPQILHTKFIQIDQAVYVGSANLDRRSFGINYELMVRFDLPQLAEEGRALFGQYLEHSTPIERRGWQRSRTFWERIRERFACTLFARLDPFLTRRQLRDLR